MRRKRTAVAGALARAIVVFLNAATENPDGTDDGA